MAIKAINDLLPGTNYAIQARAISKESVGEWSRKFVVTTASDANPKTPANVTFTFNDDSYVATWSPVVQNTDNATAVIFKYEMQLRNGAAGTVKNFSIAPSDDDPQEHSWTFEKIKQLYGNGTTSLDFRVRAVSMLRDKSAWSGWVTSTAAAPNAPTNAVVTAVVDGIKISWTAPVNTTNLDGYHVYISTTAGFTPSAANLVYTGKSTSFTYNTSTYATHYIKIRSYSKYGLESPDLSASGAPTSPFVVDTTAPDLPVLSGTLNRSGNTATANLTWTFNETLAQNKDIQAFAIKWYKNGDSGNFYIDNATKDARSLVIPLPQPFADYQFQIASIDFVANYSAWSTPALSLNGSVPGAPPQVTGVTASTGLDSITLSWTASTALDVSYYIVDIATNSGFTTGLISTTTGSTNLTVSGLTANTTYYYRVSAVDTTALTGTASTTASIATKTFPTTSISDGNPPASSPAATAVGGIGYIFVSWPAVANNDAVTYEVHISTTAGFTPTLGSATKVAETSATNVVLEKDAAGVSLAYGTTYYVRIIAKDRDTTSGNAPVAGTVSSASPAKLQNSDSALVITAADVQTGTLGASVITLGTGGIIKSANYDATAKTGFSLTETALTIYNGTVAAETLASNTSITANLTVTGSLTVSASGAIKSSNYVANTTGFSLSSAGLDVRSGTISFGTLVGGTVNATGLSIGAGGLLTVDSTGAIQSNNWASLSTGWRVSSTGIEMNDSNSKIKVTAIVGDTISGRVLTINSGGYIQSSNWDSVNKFGFKLDYNSFTLYNGTISGSSITTNSLTSLTNDATTGQPLFSINAGGYAQLAGARILGNTVLGSASSATHYIQSYNYSPGSAGWKIDATGAMEINNATIRGSITSTNGGFSTVLNTAQLIFNTAYNTYSGNVQIGSGSNIMIQPPSDTSGRAKLELNAGSVSTMTFSGSIFTIDAGSPLITWTSGALGFSTGGGAVVSIGSGGLITCLGLNATGNTVTAGTLSLTGGGITQNSALDLNVPSGNLNLSGSSNYAARLNNSTADVSLVMKGGALIVGQATWSNASVSGGTRMPIYVNKVFSTVANVVDSDARFKKDILELENASEIIEKVQINTFLMNDDDDGATRKYGIIAQELLEVLPDAVITTDSNRYAVQYDYLFSVNVAATKELIKDKKALEEKVNTLEERLARLEELVTTWSQDLTT